MGDERSSAPGTPNARSVAIARVRSEAPPETKAIAGETRCPRGEAVAQKVFGPIAEDVEGFAVVPEEFIGSGERVAAVVRYTGTGEATGKALDLPAVHVWDIRDGRLARFRQFIDTVKFAEVVPVPAAV